MDITYQKLFACAQLIYANDFDQLTKCIQPDFINMIDAYNRSLLYYVIEFDANMAGYNPENREIACHYYLRKKIFKFLIKYGADVNLLCNGGKTPISEAICNEQLYYVKYMFKHGKVQINDYINHLMLFTAKNINRYISYTGITYKMISVLLSGGVDINTVDESGNSALHLVLSEQCYSNLLEIEQVAFLLIDKGIKVNLQNNEGDTALMIAIRNCFAYVIYTLIDYEADKTLKNLRGETAQTLGKISKYAHISNLLEVL